ncbi:MAG TPA: glycosyltransferase family 4 protein [Rickettsiales bacterium]|nr:glycosyltransferase family 4 protein [Rickettsiales bacterium]
MSSTNDKDRALPDVILIGAFPESRTLIEGSEQAAVYGLAHALRARNDIASFQVIALPQSPSTDFATVSGECDGIRVTWLRRKRFSSGLRHLPFIVRQIRQAHIPVVHVHGTGLLQWAVLAYAKHKRWRSVWTLYGLKTEETLDAYSLAPTMTGLFRHLFYKKVETLCMKAAPAIIADSPYMAEQIVHKAGISKEMIRIVPHGIFTAQFRPLQNRQSAEPQVVSVGALVPRKGHHLTIEAFAQMKQRLPDARLFIAGEMRSASYYRQLFTLIEKQGMAESIVIAANPSRTQVLEALGNARIFALHSKDESQDMALCEALAAGLPVVATKVGGIPWVIEDGSDGLLAPYGNVETFSSHMRALLTDNALHARMTAAAKTCSLRFDWKNIADEVMKVYSSLRP